VADALFRRDPAWLGADGAISVPLGDHRTLWLFGDSFIAPPGGTRKQARMVRNSIAIQTGKDPRRATMRFFHRRDDQGSPSAFFQSDHEDTWLWPGASTRVGSSLLLFLIRVKRTGSGAFGFKAVSSAARLVENPSDDPFQWRLRRLASFSPGPRGVLVGTGSAVLHGSHLYAFSVVEPGNHDVYLLRWRVEQGRAVTLVSPEWWTGAGWGSASGSARPLFSEGQTEFSVHVDRATGRWIQVQTVGFTRATIGVRTAPAPQGPWSPVRVVYEPPESRRLGVLVYSARAHPHLAAPGGVLVTYNSNASELARLVRDSSLYYPRFVTLPPLK
jgi:hypothetical protein